MTKTLTRTATRTLHLVDIENLVGDPKAPASEVLAALRDYRTLAGWREGDQVILAANRGLLSNVAFDLPIACNPHARDLGVQIVVVARPGSISNSLQGQGFGIRLLADTAPEVTLAA